MDDYVTKPFRAAELLRAVERFAPEAAPVPDEREPAQPPEQATAPLPASEPTSGETPPVLDWDGALRHLDNNEELLRELAAMFLDECPKLMAAIETAQSSGDASELRRAAHTLKGSADVVGARAAATAASRLEELGRDGELEAVPNAQRMLAAEVSRLRPVLRKAAAGAD